MDYIKRVNNMLMSNELMTKKGNVLSTRGEGRSGKEGRQGGVVRAGATQSEHWQEAGEQGGTGWGRANISVPGCQRVNWLREQSNSSVA